MKSKAPLALIEQTIMILVFALAAALCLRVFVWSEQTSKRDINRDRAVVEAQNAAEILKSEGQKGVDEPAALQSTANLMTDASYQPADHALVCYYDKDWNPVSAPEHAIYTLFARQENSGIPTLCLVHVSVEGQKGDVLFELDTAWQMEESR